MSLVRHPNAAVVAAVLCLAMPGRSAAQTFTWNGPATGSAAWAAAGNWTGGVPASATNTTVNFPAGLNLAAPLTVTGVPTGFTLNTLTLAQAGAGPLTLDGGSYTFAANGATQPRVFLNAPGDARLTGDIAVTGTSLNLIGTGNTRLILNGVVTGTGGLNYSPTGGANEVYLTGRNGTFTGPTTVGTTATLFLGGTNALSRRSAVTVNGAVFLNPTAAAPLGLTPGSYDQRFGSLAGAATGVIDLGNAVLTAGFDNTNTTFAGTLNNTGTEAGSLIKAGTGILTLTGDNIYTGGTQVTGGTLLLGGTLGALPFTTGLSVAGGSAVSLETAAIDRLPNTLPVTLTGGRMRLLGAGTEQVGPLTVPLGQARIDVAAGGTYSYTTVVLGLTAAVELQSTGTTNVRTTAPATVGNIVPRAFSTAGNTFELVKVTANNLVPLVAADYTTFAAGGATANVKDTPGGVTPAAAATRNSLTLSASGTTAVNAGLTLTTGMLGGPTGGTAVIAGSGSLQFGPAATPTTASVIAPGAGAVTLAVPAAAADFAKSGPGTVTIQRPVTLAAGGTVAVNAGTLAVANDGTTTSGGFVNAATYRVMPAATLDVTGLTALGNLTFGTGQRLEGGGTVLGRTFIENGATLAATGLPGPAVLTVAAQSWNPNGAVEFRLSSVLGATGVQGQGFTQSLIAGTGTLDLSGLTAAGRFVVRPITLRADNTAGPLGDFDALTRYEWTFANFAGGVTGFTSADQFTVDASQFVNATGGGTFSVARMGDALVLVFTPVPEPTGLLAVAVVVGVGRRLAGRRGGGHAAAPAAAGL
jgi:autotransporter-associated beta strand protein